MRSLLSIRESALTLGIHANTVKRLIDVGDLPHVRVGQRVLVHPEDLDAFIASRRRTGRSQRLVGVSHGASN